MHQVSPQQKHKHHSVAVL